MPAYDYSAVADIYDEFCVFDADLEYFRRVAEEVGGKILELMAGTGRVSLPMLECGARLTCVDGSPPMLAVLRRKLAARGLHAEVVCADVTALPVTGRFEAVVLPFQGFSELVGEDAQHALMQEATRVLEGGGRFVCTAHNPTVRSATVDGSWHEVARFEHPSGRSLAIHLRTDRTGREHAVAGVQKIEIHDGDGRLTETREVELEFSLAPPDRILEMAASAGMRLGTLHGDYTGAPWDPASSPAFIAIFEKRT